MKYSIKMRSSQKVNEKDIHLSGAERIVDEKNLMVVLEKLASRALNHSRGEADFINLKINKIKEEDIIRVKALKTRTIKVDNKEEGYRVVAEFLNKIGINNIQKVLNLLLNTINMRGAIILNILSLERMEDDWEKGVRVTNMDYEKEGDIEIKNHYKEALCLATKTLNAKAIVGEICISDDPDYVTGYVATKNEYIRITKLKDKGSFLGGRIFLYDPRLDTLENTISYLENQLVVVYE